MPRVTGFIELPNASAALRSAIVHVRVEDTSRMDAPAILLGEQTFEGILPDQLVHGELAFDVLVETPVADASCAVRVHLDLDRAGVVSVGDYVSTKHIAVLQNADAQPVRISVSRVR